MRMLEAQWDHSLAKYIYTLDPSFLSLLQSDVLDISITIQACCSRPKHTRMQIPGTVHVFLSELLPAQGKPQLPKHMRDRTVVPGIPQLALQGLVVVHALQE